MLRMTGLFARRTPFKILSDRELLTDDFMAWVGSDADVGTAHIIRAALDRAATADIVQVVETMRNARPRDRAAWVVGALKTARAERLA